MFSVHASRLFERNLRASLGVSFFSVTSAGCRRLHLGGLDLPRSSSAFRLGGMTLNMDEFRVMDLKPSLAVTIDPFFSSTTTGSGLKGVLSLFFFGCLTSTVSPGLISFGFVPSFKSA